MYWIFHDNYYSISGDCSWKIGLAIGVRVRVRLNNGRSTHDGQLIARDDSKARAAIWTDLIRFGKRFSFSIMRASWPTSIALLLSHKRSGTCHGSVNWPLGLCVHHSAMLCLPLQNRYIKLDMTNGNFKLIVISHTYTHRKSDQAAWIHRFPTISHCARTRFSVETSRSFPSQLN